MKDLTSGNIYKNFLLFSIPMALSGVMSQSFHIINSIIAGNFLGDIGLAATGSTSHIVSFLSSGFWGINIGYGVYIGKLFGAKEHKKMKTAIFSGGVALTAVVLLVAMLAFIFREPIYSLLNIDPAIRKDVDIYFTVIMFGMVFTKLQHYFLCVMNAMGSSGYPFLMSVLSSVINVAGNISTVTLLRWGVFGIALSTVVSSLVVVVCYYIKISGYLKKLNIKEKIFEGGLTCIKEGMKIGIPSGFQQLSLYISSLLLSPIINGMGASATAGYVVASNLYNFNSAIYQNASKTLSNYAAQCVGAEKYDDILKGLKAGLIQNLAFSALPIIACSVFAEPICKAFFPAGFSGEALDFAILYARVHVPFLFFGIIKNLFHSLFRGIAAMGNLIVGTIVGSSSQLLLSLLFTHFFGMEGIYMGWSASFVVEAVYCLFVYLLKYRSSEKMKLSILISRQ